MKAKLYMPDFAPHPFILKVDGLYHSRQKINHALRIILGTVDGAIIDNRTVSGWFVVGKHNRGQAGAREIGHLYIFKRYDGR